MTVSKFIENNIQLAPYTTLRIGGPARYLITVDSEDQLRQALAFAREKDLPVFILGGGSNVLVSDRGFDGVVIRVAMRGIDTVEVNETTVEVTARAGEDWDRFVQHCVSENLAGVECLSGIPGLIGGTPVQNVGAYGQEVSETIIRVRCLDRTSGEKVTLSNAECGFGYRTSIFNSSERDRYVVLDVTFQMVKAGRAKLAYKDLSAFFANRNPTLKEVREAVLSIRRAKSMVLDAGDPNAKSAGSFFKNPVVELSKLEEIKGSFPDLPYFEFGNKFKIPAAWLIENSGFHKGFFIGNAGISSKHTLALINRGGATAADILQLMGKIQAEVVERFGIDLMPEPVFVGF